MNSYTNSSDQRYVPPSSSHNGIPQLQFHPNANDPLVQNCAQPSLSANKPRSSHKRKAEDEQQGRRVRAGAPPPSALALISGVDSILLSARERAGDGESRRSWEKEDVEHARILGGVGAKEDSSSGTMPHSTGRWAAVNQEMHSFEQDDPRRTLVTRGLDHSSLSPEMHSTPLRYGSNKASSSSLSPKMYGTPPNSRGHQAMPQLGYVKREKSETEDAEDDEVQESSKQTQTNATYMQEMEAGRADPRQIQSKALNVHSSKLPELYATIAIFPYSGLKLGQLLPCGEILGFVELPPVAQLYDLYSISSIKPQPEHAWIQQTWYAIQVSTGIRAPVWQQNYWYEETNRSGTERKELNFRAIRTFRELGEKLWQTSIVELMEETLNLFQKEMDYTVLLLLVHRHQDDRAEWEQRLKVLFARLDPALRPRNALPRLMTPHPASAFNTQTHVSGYAPLLQTSGLPVVKEEWLEHPAFFNPWTNHMGPSPQGTLAQGTIAAKDGPMGMMF